LDINKHTQTIPLAILTDMPADKINDHIQKFSSDIIMLSSHLEPDQLAEKLIDIAHLN
jgi:hypothetical protein